MDALTDPLLLLRFGFGFMGATLIGGAVDLANCACCTPPLIEAYILALLAPDPPERKHRRGSKLNGSRILATPLWCQGGALHQKAGEGCFGITC